MRSTGAAVRAGSVFHVNLRHPVSAGVKTLRLHRPTQARSHRSPSSAGKDTDDTAAWQPIVSETEGTSTAEPDY